MAFNFSLIQGSLFQVKKTFGSHELVIYSLLKVNVKKLISGKNETKVNLIDTHSDYLLEITLKYVSIHFQKRFLFF